MFATFYEAFAYVMFMFVLGITPGPNNLLVLQASAAGGVRATLTLILGIALGLHTMLALFALGLISAVAAAPFAQGLAQFLAGLVLFFLSLRTVFSSHAPSKHRPAAALSGFLGGAAFQLINPKAWAVVFSLAAMFAAGSEGFLRPALLFALGVPVSLTTLFIWAVAGGALRRRLSTDRARAMINYALGAVLFALAAWFTLDGLIALLAASAR